MKKPLFLALMVVLLIEIGILWNIDKIASAVASYKINKKIDLLSQTVRELNKAAPPSEIVPVYLSRADAYFMKSNYGPAITDYSKVIEIDPKNTEAYMKRGRAYMKKGDFKESTDDFNSLLKFSTDIDEKINAAELLSNAYIKLKEFEKAGLIFDGLIKTAPGNPYLYQYRGNAYGKKGDFDKAIADYSKAVELDSKNVGFYYGRGVFYYKKNDYEKAIQDFSRAIEINPKKVSPYYNRGTAYYRIGNDEAAYADFIKVIKMRPFGSIFRMKIVHKIAAIGISDLTGYRFGRSRHHPNGRSAD